MIVECIRTVGRGERSRKPLSYDQAYRVMSDYLDGQVDDDQMAMLMMLIRVNNETPAEIAGFSQAFKRAYQPLGADIDWPCYAGKRGDKGPLWQLVAAKILAANGYKILLHGDSETSSKRIYVADHVQTLGIPTATSLDNAKQLLEEQGIAYLPLDVFAPQAKHMMAWRERYGLRTPINTVVRGLNPSQAPYGIRGSFHPGFPQLHAEVEHYFKHQKVVSIKGQNGESEYIPKVSQSVWRCADGEVTEHYWQQEPLSGLPQPQSCPLGTPTEHFETMAQTIVMTMTAVLFAKYDVKQDAYDQALNLWEKYCA
ncbi:glycosyl transferase family protein [Vibrio sp. SCSIO 43136]|uniref:glycosyl transferase family protein n=1 Tax=Vibrio sp. SCSIO 43136 TaxID=2819101 RepID=UPI002075E677|nr:glycosyl transferase family protein [Vibrio sp. SCSIO 43136]USD67497.1 glycosyl transferase family protein [Vibrio sp. SCSIO 43136]